MKKSVAVKIKNGTCVSLSICKNVDELEYNKYLNECSEYEQEQVKKENEKNEYVLSLEKRIEMLEQEIKVLKGED